MQQVHRNCIIDVQRLCLCLPLPQLPLLSTPRTPAFRTPPDYSRSHSITPSCSLSHPISSSPTNWRCLASLCGPQAGPPHRRRDPRRVAVHPGPGGRRLAGRRRADQCRALRCPVAADAGQASTGMTARRRSLLPARRCGSLLPFLPGRAPSLAGRPAAAGAMPTGIEAGCVSSPVHSGPFWTRRTPAAHRRPAPGPAAGPRGGGASPTAEKGRVWGDSGGR
jgi:hypothetical protein